MAFTNLPDEFEFQEWRKHRIGAFARRATVKDPDALAVAAINLNLDDRPKYPVSRKLRPFFLHTIRIGRRIGVDGLGVTSKSRNHSQRADCDAEHQCQLDCVPHRVPPCEIDVVKAIKRGNVRTGKYRRSLQNNYPGRKPTRWVTLRRNNPEPLMSALGQKRTWRDQIAMSALPPIADIPRRNLNVRFGPNADIPSGYKNYKTLQFHALALFLNVSERSEKLPSSWRGSQNKKASRVTARSGHPVVQIRRR